MQNRRNFLKSGLFAVSGAGLAGSSLANPVNPLSGEEVKFVYRSLGKSGIKIPVVSMGTGNCNNPKLITGAYERGVKLFATSEYYQNGNNEKMVGEALRDKPRDSYMIMTSTLRGISIDHKSGLFKEETDPEQYLEGVHASLDRLQLDYIDILSVAFGAKRESVFFEPLLEAAQKLKDSGKTKYLCLTTHKFEPEAIRAAADTGVYDMVTTAYNFRRENREEIEDSLKYAVEAGLGIIAMKTMAGAYWDKEKTQPIDAQAALKWVLRNKNIHTTIPDCANYDHLEADLAIMEDLELSEEDKLRLEPPAEDLASGLYCQQCNQCISQCPENLDIPTVMRSYMYAYGYRNLELARQTFDIAELQDGSCSECSHCRVNCSVGFDIRQKILDISRIGNIPEDFLHYS